VHGTADTWQRAYDRVMQVIRAEGDA